MWVLCDHCYGMALRLGPFWVQSTGKSAHPFDTCLHTLTPSSFPYVSSYVLKTRRLPQYLQFRLNTTGFILLFSLVTFCILFWAVRILTALSVMHLLIWSFSLYVSDLLSQLPLLMFTKISGSPCLNSHTLPWVMVTAKPWSLMDSLLTWSGLWHTCLPPLLPLSLLQGCQLTLFGLQSPRLGCISLPRPLRHPAQALITCTGSPSLPHRACSQPLALILCCDTSPFLGSDIPPLWGTPQHLIRCQPSVLESPARQTPALLCSNPVLGYLALPLPPPDPCLTQPQLCTKLFGQETGNEAVQSIYIYIYLFFSKRNLFTVWKWMWLCFSSWSVLAYLSDLSPQATRIFWHVLLFSEMIPVSWSPHGLIRASGLHDLPGWAWSSDTATWTSVKSVSLPGRKQMPQGNEGHLTGVSWRDCL